MSGKGLPAGQDTGYALLDQTGHHDQRVPAAGHLPAGAGGRALQHPRGPGRRQPGRRARRPAQGRGLRDRAGRSRPRRCSSTWRRAPQLSGEQIQAVTNLVSSSVQDMDPDQVTVTDSTGHVLSAAGTGRHRGAGDARSQVEQEYETRLAANAQQILDTVVGPGHAKVSVRADVDLSQRQSTSETYTYTNGTPPLSESTTTEDYSGGGTPVGGVLGPENMPDAADNAGGGDSTYNKESTTDNNAVDKTVETVESAPGALNRLTVSVVMDDAVAGSLNQQQIRDLVGNAVGLDTARGDAITVASMPFDTTAADARRRGDGGGPRGRVQRPDVVDDPHRRHRGRHRARRPPGLAALAPPGGDRGGVRAPRAHRRHARRARPAAGRQHPRGSRPRSTRRHWSSRPPSGRRCGGRSPPWSASVPTRSRRCSAAG